MDIARQVTRWVALGALFLIPFAPLVVVNGFFFPFISGKAFYLRTLIEILVAAWLVLALADKAYRPRFSWLGVAAIAFVAWMFVADLAAINVMKAFWSNFERMEGWVLLIHLLGFFYAAGAVLRVEKKWRAWFLASLIASALISVYALFQLSGSLDIHQGSTRIDATLGNSAYLAIYLLFSVFVALWLALTEKFVWLKWTLLGLAAVETILIFFTETRGTVIGLVLGLGIAALLVALTGGKRARGLALAGLLVLIVVVGGFYMARNSSLVQNNHVLQRVASISLSDGQTRFTIWHMALDGVKERPILGWGQEGFNYVFNKYYDPKLYTQEAWFDRAHNAFLDWLTAGGVPAFLLYVSLFGIAIFLLWRSSELSRPERIALTAALVGYAVHNLFVFDNLYSYIYFFALLSLIDSQTGRPIRFFEEGAEINNNDIATIAIPVAVVVCSAIIWYVNLTGIGISGKLISALSANDVTQSEVAFQSLVASPNFATQEVREQMVSYASAVVNNAQISNEQKQSIVTLAITEMQKQVKAYPLDAREHMELSYAYRIAGDVQDSLSELTAALALSPKKEGILIEKGTLELSMNDTKAAQQDFNAAYALGPQFSDLAGYAAAGDILNGNQKGADAILLQSFGTTTVDLDILSSAYYHTKDWQHLIGFWRLRANRPGAPVESWYSLAASYYAAGNKTEAIRVLQSTEATYPESAATAESLIKQIQQGK